MSKAVMMALILFAGDSAAPHVAPIIIRDDRSDARYQQLAKDYADVLVDLRIPFRDPARTGANGMGVLVGDTWILTSAHTAAAIQEGGPMSRVHGPHSVLVGGSRCRVASVHLHPQWRPGGPGPHDIALIRLAGPIKTATDLPRPTPAPTRSARRS